MAASWHEHVGFADRLSEISKMQNEYHELIAKSVQLLRAAVPAEPYPDAHEDEHLFPNYPASDAKIGRFTHATHFADGLFSEVYRAADPDDISPQGEPVVVALKITTPAMMTPPHDSEREARILSQARGSTVVPLRETFLQPGGHLVLVFPFLPYDLQTLLSKQALCTNSGFQRFVLRDLFSGLSHIHSLGILHRDIKPSNILLASLKGPAYIADFGIAWSAADPSSEPADRKILDVGTTSYRAPELLFGGTSYSVGVDLWAAGCVAAQLTCSALHARPLFDAGDLGSELALIRSIFTNLGTPDDEGLMWPEAKSSLPDWGKMRFMQYPTRPWADILPSGTINDHARDLVASLLVYESNQRLKADAALSHPFFTTAAAH